MRWKSHLSHPVVVFYLRIFVCRFSHLRLLWKRAHYKHESNLSGLAIDLFLALHTNCTVLCCDVAVYKCGWVSYYNFCHDMSKGFRLSHVLHLRDQVSEPKHYHNAHPRLLFPNISVPVHYGLQKKPLRSSDVAWCRNNAPEIYRRLVTLCLVLAF